MTLIQNLKFLQFCYLSWQVLVSKSLLLCKEKSYGHQIFEIFSSQWVITIVEIWKNSKFLSWHSLSDLPWNYPKGKFAFSNGPKDLPINSPDCTILNSWVYNNLNWLMNYLQKVYTIFISNNCALFHLWWLENLLKHQKVWKYYESGCLKSFLLLFMSLLIAPTDKNSHI